MAVAKQVIFGLLVIAGAYVWNSSRERETELPGVVVTVKNGKLQGIETLSRDGRPVYGWLGIPYAKPPVGELRFEVRG
jgi:hypothetical protein